MRGVGIAWGAMLIGCACTTPPAANDAAFAPDAHGPEDASVTITISGELRRLDTGDLLPGADVCRVDVVPEHCIQTDATGFFAFAGLPQNGEIELELRPAEPELLRARLPLKTGLLSDYILGTALIPRAQMQATLAAAGITWDEASTGIVAINAGTGGPLVPYGFTPMGIAGLSVAIEGGGTLAYQRPDQSLDPLATATTSGGWAMAFGVAPGARSAHVTHPALECVPDAAWGWRGPTDDDVRFGVAPGVVTYGGNFHCVAR
jgi:hypothetical protein